MLAVAGVACAVFVTEAIINHKWYRHLTHWTWLAHTVLVLILLCEFWRRERRLVSDSVLLVGSSLAAGVVGGMVVLYVEDQSILEDARRQYGRVNMELGNILLHYVPLPLYWVYFLSHTRARSLFDHFFESGASHAVMFVAAHLAFPISFTFLYATLYSPQEEYGEGISSTSMATAIVCFMFINYIGFLFALTAKMDK